METVLTPTTDGLGLAEYLNYAAPWSFRTFGPGKRFKGVAAHIRKELAEFRAARHDTDELADLFILGLDGYWRQVADGIDPRGFDWSDYSPDDRALDMLIDLAVVGGPDCEKVIEQMVDRIERGTASDNFAGHFLEVAVCSIALAGEDHNANWCEFRATIWSKLSRNMNRQWPDWRNASEDQPIEHIRSEVSE